MCTLRTCTQIERQNVTLQGGNERFTNIPFDYGYYRYTVQCIGSFDRGCRIAGLIPGAPFLDQFLVGVLRPKVLYISSVKLDLMKDTVLRFARHGVCVTSRSTIFHVLLLIFGKMPQETQLILLTVACTTLSRKMSPLCALRLIQSSMFHAALLFCAFHDLFHAIDAWKLVASVIQNSLASAPAW